MTAQTEARLDRVIAESQRIGLRLKLIYVSLEEETDLRLHVLEREPYRAPWGWTPTYCGVPAVVKPVGAHE